jgi:hypothetical protein
MQRCDISRDGANQFQGGLFTPAVDHRLFTAHPVTRLHSQMTADLAAQQNLQDTLGVADRSPMASVMVFVC